MSLRAVAALALTMALGGLLLGCGSDPPPLPEVRVLAPDGGATLPSQRVAFQAELMAANGQNELRDGTTESVTLRWSFGDGNTATGTDVTHVYDEPGMYQVSAVAVGEQGRRGPSTELTIEVRNAPPTAEIDAEPTQGEAPLEVRLDAGGSRDPDGEVSRFRWDLGNGTAQTGARTAHVYDEAGSYVVTLTVADDQGATAEATTTIQVERSRSARPPVTWEIRMVTSSGGETYFEPSVLVIEPGDTVRWTVATGRHSSTAYSKGLPEGAEPWDTGVLGESASPVEVTFGEEAPKGSYPYYCRIHKDAGMLGLIVVGEPSELDPDFREQLPDLLRTKLDELIQRAQERIDRSEGGST
ncbi:MAG: PKD domain-containing protein [Candidatus Bipolaricaulia bacterium]